MPKIAKSNGGRADQDTTSGPAVWGRDSVMALLNINSNSNSSTDKSTSQTLWATQFWFGPLRIQWTAARTSRKESHHSPSPPSRAHDSSVLPHDNAFCLAQPDPFLILMILYRLLPLTCPLVHLYRTRLCLSHGGLLIHNADSFTLHCTCCLL